MSRVRQMELPVTNAIQRNYTQKVFHSECSFCKKRFCSIEMFALSVQGERGWEWERITYKEIHGMSHSVLLWKVCR